MYVKWRYLAVTSSDGSQNLVLLVGKPETLTFPTVKKQPFLDEAHECTKGISLRTACAHGHCVQMPAGDSSALWFPN